MSLTTFAAAQLLRALPRVRISRAVGRLCDRSLPRPVADHIVRIYGRAYGVDLDEAEPQPEGYPSFDAFFTRALRSGVRRIHAASVVSPADGALTATGLVGPDARIEVKGQSYGVGELVGDESDAARYVGGRFAVVYLAPGDYHRVHSPVDGEVSSVRGIPGDLYPVNRIGERHVPGLFARNSRVSFSIDIANGGRVGVVMVGAVIVGRMTAIGVEAPDVPAGLHRLDPARGVARGDEIGVFHLGSTVVVLLEPGVALGRPLGRILYGQSLLGSE